MKIKTNNRIITSFYAFCILLFKKLVQFSVLFLMSFSFAESYDDGINYFIENKIDSAIENFELSLIDGSAQSNVYSYLGIAYLQNNSLDDALTTFTNGLDIEGTDKKQLYYNAANTLYLKQDFVQAKEYYTLSLAADNNYINAYLNRANTNVQLKEYTNALTDYRTYLSKNPLSKKAESIQQMIAAIENELRLQNLEKERLVLEAKRLEEEKQKLLKEKAAMEEQNRIAQEKAQKEAERRQKILEQVSKSLQTNHSTNISAGTEGALHYEYEEAELE